MAVLNPLKKSRLRRATFANIICQIFGIQVALTGNNLSFKGTSSFRGAQRDKFIIRLTSVRGNKQLRFIEVMSFATSPLPVQIRSLNI